MKFLPDAERSRASLHPICHPLQFNYQKTTNKHRKNTKTLPCYRVLLLVGWLCQKPRLKFQFCTVQLFPCQIWWGHKCASRARVGKSKKISYLIPSGLVVSGVVFFGAYLTTLCGFLSPPSTNWWRTLYDTDNSYQLLLLLSEEGCGLIMKPL